MQCRHVTHIFLQKGANSAVFVVKTCQAQTVQEDPKQLYEQFHVPREIVFEVSPKAEFSLHQKRATRDVAVAVTARLKI